MALKNRNQPPNTKGQVIFYTDKEKEALEAHWQGGSVAEGARISIRWAAHFWRVGLRPDFDLNHVGICLICR
jgi:hypothetical protein